MDAIGDQFGGGALRGERCAGHARVAMVQAAPAATEPVLQALPPLEESCFGWIDGRRVYAVSRDAVVIADLEAARVLDVIARTDETPLDCSAVMPAPEAWSRAARWSRSPHVRSGRSRSMVGRSRRPAIAGRTSPGAPTASP